MSKIRKEESVLYCGMADDILTPLVLVPDFTILFVIDRFDSAFAKNGRWRGQKQDIKKCLLNGNNKYSQHRGIMLKFHKLVNIQALDEPCKITHETDINGCWTLWFNYKGVERKLAYYHHTDFIAKWNKQIKNIKHLMCIGAEFPIEKEPLNTMLKERCSLNCKFYDELTEYEDTVKVYGRDYNINIKINSLKRVLG